HRAARRSRPARGDGACRDREGATLRVAAHRPSGARGVRARAGSQRKAGAACDPQDFGAGPDESLRTPASGRRGTFLARRSFSITSGTTLRGHNARSRRGGRLVLPARHAARRSRQPVTQRPPARPSRLRLGPLVAVMFFTVSGGPFGLEGLVGSVGPGVALLLLVATPLLYSVPETLLVGELASMLPAEGGYYQWVKRAFGRFWGFWNGWL